MKKIAILAALAITAFGFSSCSDDDTPVYQQPAEGSFVLNTPPLANQTFDLTSCGPIVLTCSQPAYGFTASVNYSAEMAVNDPELTAPEDLKVYNLVAEVPTSAVVSLDPTAVSTGMCVLNGIATEEDWNQNPLTQSPVWIRLVAQIGDYEYTQIKSNWVCLSNIVPFFAVPQPGKIYLVGTPSGWATPDNPDAYADWALSEPGGDGIGSNIYTGVFEIPAAPIFRFYVKLTGWDGGDSWGTQVDDSPIQFEEFGTEANPTFQHEIVNGKGSFEFPNWPGGMMTIIVDMNTHTASFMTGVQE